MTSMTIHQALDEALQHFRAGRFFEAETLYRQILSQDPKVPDALQMLGILAYTAGHNVVAANLVRSAIELAPSIAPYHSNLGLILLTLADVKEAIKAFQRAIELQPQFPPAHNNLGNAYKQQGRLDDALASFQTALSLQPQYPEALNNLAMVLQESGRVEEAIEIYNQVIRMQPDSAQAHHNLGNALKQQGRAHQAIGAYQKALQLQPNLAGTHNNLADALMDLGRINEALQAFDRALKLQPTSAQFHSNYLFAMHMTPAIAPREIFQAHLRWNEVHARSLSRIIQPHANLVAPDRRLKIGYVSPNLREHSAANFLESLLSSHDWRNFEIHCFSDLARHDQGTARMLKVSNTWNDIVGITDAQAADIVRESQIDILIDLAGHTPGNRLGMFAQKPAPVQMTFFGYPDTTGLSTVDYRLTDAYADPPGLTENLHSEQLLRLPNCFLCYTPAPYGPSVSPLPASKTGYLTFGCFNGRLKISDQAIKLWAQILRQIPRARLLLKSQSFAEPAARHFLVNQFTCEGVTADRLDLREWLSSSDEPARLYDEIDIALDTFPYNGTTTTCQAMWMGVPVVTLAGTTHVSRVGVSLLSNLGLTQTIARTEQQYVEIAMKLAGDIPNLGRLRASMRQQFLRSPLADAPRFTANVEKAYRTAWKTWCISQSAPGQIQSYRKD
ncbi:MAG: tetratricopeptide repeat protein [Planctomycetota bacterium]|nr:tetratricopeptide repeat protein [Planctomycetota bacterium]